MRPYITLLVVLITAFAGCSDAKAPPTPDDHAFQDFDDDVTEGKGMIRGIVVDATITPVQGAQVTLKGSETTTTSNEAGAFQFTDLEPGAYFLDITREGYGAVQANTEVIADVTPDVLRIQLTADPDSLPTALTLTLDGYIGCSWQVAHAVFSGDWCDGVDDDIPTDYSLGLGQAPDAAQVEVQWESTQQLGSEMTLFVCMQGVSDCNSDGRLGNQAGPSPIICRFNTTQGCGGGGQGFSAWEWTDTLEVRVGTSCFTGCVYQGEAGFGLGLVVGQKYDSYLTYFINTEPTDDWAFVNDGEYALV